MLEPLPYTPLVGETVALVLGGLLLFAMIALPVLRAPAMLLGAFHWLRRALPHLLRPRAVALDPTRPLQLGGLSAPLARLTRQTRTLALELRRCSTEASAWPEESQLPRSGWRESVFGSTGVRSPLMEMRSEVFEWMRIAETLPQSEREAVAELGIDVEAVRRILTEDSARRPAEETVRTLAGLLWDIDERLAGASTAGYRANGAVQASIIPISEARIPGPSGDDDARTRRARWAGTLADHGRGISRLAGSYTRSVAEREDLEQDIALALWRALPTFRGESSLKTFAYRVARYCCFRHVRQRKDLENPADPQTVADPGANVESVMLHADQRALIEQALTDLPDNLESVLTLHLTGHSYAQIAETLGISERNVSVRLSRARTRLRRQLVAA
jgi:RNA polymerase sigma factor (sigma-70 family)